MLYHLERDAHLNCGFVLCENILSVCSLFFLYDVIDCDILKIAILRTVLDWQNISMYILGMAFSYVLWRFYLKSVLCQKLENGPSARYGKFFSS